MQERYPTDNNIILVPLTYSITLWGFSRCCRDFYIKVFAKVWEFFRNKLSSIITEYFWWAAKNAHPVFQKVLNNNRAFALNNRGITKSGEFVNHMEVPNSFIETMKIHWNSVIECCYSWQFSNRSRRGFL